MLDPVTIERMRAWTGEKPVLLALSGGGDSVALLHLLAAELSVGRVRAAIVDHALREGSAADAQRARSLADALGVKAEVLTLSWGEGRRSQQAARLGRYRLLCDHARALGLSVIAAAHTADDQAETVLMRARAGSSWRGLAAMATFAYAPIWPEGRGVALARPILGARREALRDWLRAQNAAWIEDPANANLEFERVRIRARLAELGAVGLDPMRLAQLARRLRARAAAIDEAAQALIERAVRLEDHAIRLSRKAWTAPRQVRLRALAVLLAAAAGAAREPSSPDVDDLETAICRPGFPGATLAGAWIAPAAEGVMLTRDPGAVVGRSGGQAPAAAIELPAGREVVWDGRLAVTAAAPGWLAAPAKNAALLELRDAAGQARSGDGVVHIRSLLCARIRHAFAPALTQ
jgi:tRNA(Ile)-lysidine synthase